MLATVHSASTVLAHAGEIHEEPAAQSTDPLTTIGHQPVAVSLIICVLVLAAIYGLLNLTKMKLPAKLLSLLPVVIVLSVFYMQHNPTVSAVLLSVGFISVFLLTFTMLKHDAT